MFQCSRRHAIKLVAALSILPGQAFAQTRYPLSPAETKAVIRCRDIIRADAIPDGKGGFNQTNLSYYPDPPVWVSIPHGHFMAIALCAEYERSRIASDLELVRRWLEFAAKQQAPQGYFVDVAGTLSNYKSNNYTDAWDSSIVYVVVARRFQRLGGRVTPTMIACAKRTLACVQSLTDVDGLTFGKPGYPFKLLEDQLDVFSGLDAGRLFFNEVGAKAQALQCAAQLEKMKVSLPQYFDSTKNVYAWAKHANGSVNIGLTTLDPEAQCNLFALAFIEPKPATWNALKATFKPDDGLSNSSAGSELWAFAASRMGPIEHAHWRAKVVSEVSTFTSNKTYGYRAAWALMGLLEGGSSMPSMQSPSR